MDSRLPGQTAIPGDHWASKWSYGSWGHRDTVRFDTAIYVLHCFKKKSNAASPPKNDIELTKHRFRDAEADYTASQNEERK